MSELALKLIQEAKASRATRLDLGNCGLTELPEELFELVWLEELILSHRYWQYGFEKEERGWISSENKGAANTIKFFNPKIKLLRGLKKISANELKDLSDLSPLKDLANLQQLDVSSTQVSDLSPLKDLGNLQQLDVSETKVSDLMPLKDLVNLQQLRVPNTQVSDLMPLKDLINFQQLWANNTQVRDLMPLKDLVNLQLLSFSFTQVSDLMPLKDLVNLQLLFVSKTQVSDLMPLKDLVNLQHFSVHSTQVSDLMPLKDLVNLQLLYVSSTQVSDLMPLKDLVNLQQLSVSETQVSNLMPLKDLVNLQQLEVSSTQVSDLMPLKDLVNLQLLTVFSTQVSDLMPLKDLVNLQLLDVSETQVSDLLPLKDLVNLQLLNVSETQVSDLSPLKDSIKKGFEVKWLNAKAIEDRGLYVKDCPLDKTLISAIKKGHPAVLKYFNKPKERLFEARVLVLGEPRAGKTSLRNKLKSHNAALPEEKNSTKGIEIEIDTYKCAVEREGKKEAMQYYLWDFGGQDYYRLFHQLFVSEQSVYIIVTDTNKDTNEAEENLEFWLETIERLAKDKKGQYGPVILLQNAKTNREGKNYYDVKKRFPFWQQTEDFTINLGQIAENTEGYSATELKKFKQFKTYLENSFHQLDHIGMEMPSDWVKVRKAIAKQAKDNYISIEEFRKICTKNGVTEAQEQNDLCGILHNLGFLLYYGDTALKSMVILNKEWATDALYRVLDDEIVKHNVGWFKKEDAALIWHDEKYKDRTTELLALMQEYKIVYFNSAAQKYIVPTKLSESTEDLPDWNKNQNVRLHLQYDWLPRAVGTQLIVSLHEYLVSLENGNDWIWRKGAVLNGKKLDLSDVEVLIEDNWKDKRIEINARGTHSEYLIREIIKEWRKVNEPYEGKIQVTKKILCSCKECLASAIPTFYTYEQVLNAKEKKKPLYCNNALETFEPTDILRGVFDETTVLVDSFEQKGGKTSEELLNFIKNGQIKEALNLLPDNEFTINLKSRITHLKNNEVKGILSFDEANRERNTIANALLEYLNAISNTHQMFGRVGRRLSD